MKLEQLINDSRYEVNEKTKVVRRKRFNGKKKSVNITSKEEVVSEKRNIDYRYEINDILFNIAKMEKRLDRLEKMMEKRLDRLEKMWGYRLLVWLGIIK